MEAPREHVGIGRRALQRAITICGDITQELRNALNTINRRNRTEAPRNSAATEDNEKFKGKGVQRGKQTSKANEKFTSKYTNENDINNKITSEEIEKLNRMMLNERNNFPCNKNEKNNSLCQEDFDFIRLIMMEKIEEWAVEIRKTVTSEMFVDIKRLEKINEEKDEKLEKLELKLERCISYVQHLLSMTEKKNKIQRYSRVPIPYDQGNGMETRRHSIFGKTQKPSDHEDAMIKCAECPGREDAKFHRGLCREHGAVRYAPDAKEVSKTGSAFLTTPACIKIGVSNIVPGELGVFAATNIKAKTLFGPFIGDKRLPYSSSTTEDYSYDIKKRNRETIFIIDGEDLQTSNWMRFVNCPTCPEEQNLQCLQYGWQIYFFTTKDISAGDELLLYYGKDYAKRLGITAVFP